MDLLPKELRATLPALYTHENAKAEDVPIHVKYFTPWAGWTWYVTEGEERDGDVLMFGYVEGLEKELGYFMLSELQQVKGPFGLKIERDLYFRGNLGEVMAK